MRIVSEFGTLSGKAILMSLCGSVEDNAEGNADNEAWPVTFQREAKTLSRLFV